MSINFLVFNENQRFYDKTKFRNVYIKQFGILRHRLDVFFGIGMAVLVVVLKILGSFCDFMIALANVKGKLWYHSFRFRIIQRSFNVKRLKDQRNGSLDAKDKIWYTEFDDVAGLTDSILSKSQSALGPYLSTAFGYVKNIHWNWKCMNKISGREPVSSQNWNLTPETNFWSTTKNKAWLFQKILTRDKHVWIQSRSLI